MASCIISVEFEDELEVLVKKILTSRVAHQCNECWETISPGELYVYEVYLLEDTPQQHRTCADCYSVRQQLFSEFYYGMLWDTLYNSLEEDPEYLSWDAISYLTRIARERVFKIVETAWAYS